MAAMWMIDKAEIPEVQEGGAPDGVVNTQCQEGVEEEEGPDKEMPRVGISGLLAGAHGERQEGCLYGRSRVSWGRHCK